MISSRWETTGRRSTDGAGRPAPASREGLLKKDVMSDRCQLVRQRADEAVPPPWPVRWRTSVRRLAAPASHAGKGGLDGVTPGSSCIANAYSNNHNVIVSKDTGAVRRVALHVVDALGLVHALILQLQALVLPVTTLVFSGH